MASFLNIMWNNCHLLCYWSSSCFVDLSRYCIWSWSLARWQKFYCNDDAINRLPQVECNLLLDEFPAYIILTSLNPHFYIVKLGFTGVYIIFLISAQNIDCGYSLEPPHRGGSNEYPQSMFWAEIWKYQRFFFFIGKCSVFGGEIFYIFE